MLALVFDGTEARVEDRPVPAPGRDEALIAVRRAGICRTDLEVLRGYLGFEGVMGHEFVGVVSQGPPTWKGKRVVGEINCVCGECDLCASGLSNHCPHRTVIGIDGRDGAFAEFLTLPVRNLHAVPDAVGDDAAVFVEPLAAACQVLRQVAIGRGDRVVVLGDGRLGQLVARVLRGRAGRLVLVGKHAGKLQAAEKVRIQTCPLEQFVPRRDADLVVEATGSPSGLELALATVRPRGTVVLKSTFTGRTGANLTPAVIDEVTIVGSRCGPFGDAITALAGGAVDVSALLGPRFPLADGVEALAAARRPENVKVLLEIGG